MSIVLLLLPDLSLVVLGWLLSRSAIWTRPFWDGLERLVYYVLFPTLLFQSVLRAPLSFGQALPSVLTVVASALVALAAVALARPLLRPDPLKFASGAQCAFRFNTYVALALAQRLGGDNGVALCALIIGVMVPISNVGAIIPLARHAGSRIGRELVRNPLILATVGGLIGNACGLQLPEPLTVVLGRLGSAALATGLLTVGAGLVFGAPAAAVKPAGDLGGTPGGNSAGASAGGDLVSRRPGAQAGGHAELALSTWLTVIKLIVMPATAMALAWAIALAPAARVIVVMFAAMPTASSCYILAVRMGGDGPYVARLVSISMLGALITLPFWLSWLVA